MLPAAVASMPVAGPAARLSSVKKMKPERVRNPPFGLSGRRKELPLYCRAKTSA
jgi:hypothetical protein